MLVTDQGYLHEQASRPSNCTSLQHTNFLMSVSLCTGNLSALRGTYSTILHCLVSARAVVQISALRLLLQDAVWEKLDTIDGNTVYVGSRINQPGEFSAECPHMCIGGLAGVCSAELMSIIADVQIGTDHLIM